MTTVRTKTNPAALLMLVRTWHTYIGMLIAPAVLFFAGTGILQIYSLHEAHAGYTPPALIEKLGRLHKDQVFAPGEHHDAGPADKAPDVGGPPAHDDPPPKLATTLLKAFFALAAVGLIGSTSAGVWMALRQGQSRRTVYAALLVVGAIVPAALAALGA